MTQTSRSVIFFFFNDTPTPEIYPLSLPDALPIYLRVVLLDLPHDAPDRLVDEREPDLLGAGHRHRIVRSQSRREARHATCTATRTSSAAKSRSEEHTSQLQSPSDHLCPLLL